MYRQDTINTEHKQLQAPFHYHKQNECAEFQMTLVMHISLLRLMWRSTEQSTSTAGVEHGSAHKIGMSMPQFTTNAFALTSNSVLKSCNILTVELLLVVVSSVLKGKMLSTRERLPRSDLYVTGSCSGFSTKKSSASAHIML